MEKFKVEEANREPAIAVNLAAESNSLSIIPDVSQVKEYGRVNNLNYSIPRFIGKNHSYICSRYIKKKIENWVTQINPIILSTEGLVFVEETQHGVDGVYLVPRHPRVLVAYTEAGSFKPVQRELIGLASLQFQQALHAINGLFISDFGLRIDDNPDYLEADDEGKNSIAQEYFKALQASFEEEVKSDEKIDEYLKATEFISNNISRNNLKNGVVPGWVEKELNKEADEAE